MRRSIPAMGLACLLCACAHQAPRPTQPTIDTGSDVVLITAKGNNVTIHTVPEGKVRIDADADKVDTAFKLVKDGKLKAAMEPLNEVIDHYESRYGQGDMAVYSAHAETDALVYAMLVNLSGKSQETIVFGPAWAMAYWMRGYIYGEMNQFDEEIRELGKALALAPMDPQYNNELAFVYAQKRDFAKAMALYEQAEAHAELASTPDMVNHYKCVSLRGKGYVLVELHKLDEAESAYKSCLAITHDEPRSLAELEYIKGLRSRQ
ncbi:tetratricopeptide repeat protein [Dyella sp. EPa41]|uniref:tetratricopeptide repeat protein n=1 Tax=Dyella sp. EPa41 TaxID=1561194 RepID=UPI001914F494|nr:tetratricopeptide repeat protein [Dyella sp. EPa41]